MASDRMKGTDRKQAIIEAARPLFAQNGFNGTSVRTIAKAAGGTVFDKGSAPAADKCCGDAGLEYGRARSIVRLFRQRIRKPPLNND